MESTNHNRVMERVKFASMGVWQGSAGFVYSCAQYYDRRETPKYVKFHNQTGYTLQPGVGIDSSIYKGEWNGTKVIVEKCYS